MPATVHSEYTRATLQSIFSDQANMYVAALGHGIVYSLSVPLFVGCLYTLNRRRSSKVNILLTVYLIIMFCLSTAHVITHLQFYRLVLVEHGSDPTFAAKPSPLHVANNSFMIAVAVLADWLMIWRCWLIWDKRIWIICLPFLLSLGTLASLITWMLIGWTSKGFISFALLTTTFSVSTNIFVTSLIILRILYMRRQLHKAFENRVYTSGPSDPYLGVVNILIESCTLYSVFGIVYLITLGFGSVGEQVTVSLLSAIPPLATYLVIIRVNLGTSIDKSPSISGSLPTIDIVGSRNPPFSVGQVTIHFEKVVEHN